MSFRPIDLSGNGAGEQSGEAQSLSPFFPRQDSRQENDMPFVQQVFSPYARPGSTLASMLRSTVGSGGVANKLGEFLGVGGLAKGVAQAIYYNTPEGRKLLKDVRSGYVSPKEFTPMAEKIASPGEVIGSGVQTLGTLLAGGSVGPAESVAQRIGVDALQTGAASALTGAGRAIEQGEPIGDVMKSGAKSGAIGATVGGTLSGLSELMQYASKVVPQKILDKAFGVSPKLVEKGRSPSARFLEEGRGVTGQGILKNAEKGINQARSEIKDILVNDGNKISSTSVIDGIRRDLTEKFGVALSPNDIDAMVSKLPIDILRRKDFVTKVEANALRETIGSKFLGDSKWIMSNPSENISALRSAYGALRDVIQGSDDRLPSLFSREAYNITLKNSLDKELARKHALTLLFEALGSGLYGSISGQGMNADSFKKTIGAFLTLRAMSSIPAKVVGAKAIEAAGNIASAAGTKSVSRILVKSFTR